MRETIQFTKRAARRILRESLRCEGETGGTLFGYGRGRVVDTATGPGPRATKEACLFSADVEFQRRAAERIASQSDGRCKLIGYWHRHTGSMGNPSAGDQAQARTLAADFSRSDGACNLLVLITTVDEIRRRVRLHAYVFCSRSKRLVQATSSVVPDDAPVVARARQDEPAIPVARKGDLFNDPAFRFHKTLMGSKRLRSEVEELKSRGFDVSVSRRKKDGRALLVVVDPRGRRLIVIPPIEYPLNPPRVFELPHGNEWLGAMCLAGLNWNSDRRIIDVLSSEPHGLTSLGCGV